MSMNFSPDMIEEKHKDILTDLIKYRFMHEVIREKTGACMQKVLNENKIMGKKTLIDEDENINYEEYRVLDIKDDLDIYVFGEDNFSDFLKLNRIEEEKIGIYKKSPHLGADLVIHSIEIDLENELMDSFENLTGMDCSDIYGEDRKKYLGLLEGLIITVMDEKNIENMKSSILDGASFVDVENKIRFDTSFKPNELLKDFSVEPSEILAKELFDEPSDEDRQSAMKEMNQSKNLDYKL